MAVRCGYLVRRSAPIQGESEYGADLSAKAPDLTYLQSLGLFWVLILGIIVIPGMDMLLVLSNTMARGLRSGFAALSGIIAGGAVHTIWGLLSVALILGLPPLLIPVMLTAGALYLAWIGWTLLNSAITVGEDTPDPSRRAFRQGLVTCLLNPKAWVFVVSVFPQFVRLPENQLHFSSGLL